MDPTERILVVRETQFLNRYQVNSPSFLRKRDPIQVVNPGRLI